MSPRRVVLFSLFIMLAAQTSLYAQLSSAEARRRVTEEQSERADFAYENRNIPIAYNARRQFTLELTRPVDIEYKERRNVLPNADPLAFVTQEDVDNAPNSPRDDDIPFQTQFGGYVKWSSVNDTRQVVEGDDLMLLLWPKPIIRDACGDDLNGHPAWNFNVLESRMRFDAVGPRIFNALPIGYMEFDAAGVAGTGNTAIINRFRWRHLFIELKAPYWNWLAGLYWHPMYITNCLPEVLSYNGGVPMESFARSPQFRVSTRIKYNTVLTFSFVTQLTDPSDGPIGPETVYLRNAVLPDLNFQVQHQWNQRLMTGAMIDYVRLIPRLKTNRNFDAREHVESLTATVFARVDLNPLTMRVKAIYAENGFNWTMLGGYGVHSFDPTTDHRTYTNTRVVSAWLDMDTRVGYFTPALFVGWTKNYGSRCSVIQSIINPFTGIPEPTIYGTDPSINTVWRISPRITWNVKPLVLGAELEATYASFGTLNNFAKPENAVGVTNLRYMIAAFLFF